MGWGLRVHNQVGGEKLKSLRGEMSSAMSLENQEVGKSTHGQGSAVREGVYRRRNYVHRGKCTYLGKPIAGGGVGGSRFIGLPWQDSQKSWVRGSGEQERSWVWGGRLLAYVLTEGGDVQTKRV